MFKEEVTRADITDLQINKIKGHTKIELTDETTGEKKVVEYDNTFQSNILSKFMRSLGAYNNSPYTNSTWAGRNIWRNLLGGIFLFRDEIDLTQGDVEYMPATNEMVANGAYGVSNSGTPTEMGSFNAIESSVGPTSIVMVYDWGTAQGNGTIGSVCLTSEIGGYIGYGNKSGDKASSLWNYTANQNSTSKSGIAYNNVAHWFKMVWDEEKLYVKKKPMPVESVSIFDAETETEIDCSSLAFTRAESEVFYAYMGGTKIAFIPQRDGDVAAGATYNFVIYDMATGTVSQGKVINSTGGTIPHMWYMGGQRIPFGFTNDRYMIWFDDKGSSSRAIVGPIHVFDVMTGALVCSIGDDSISYYVYENEGAIAAWTPGFFKVDRDLYNIEEETALVDNSTNRTSETMIYNSYYDAMQKYSYLVNHNDRGVYVPNANSNLEMYKNPMYLATVNNLGTPVTKNNTQTMKVTYTLTEVQE